PQPAPTKRKAAAAAPPAAAVAAPREQLVTVTTPAFRVVFSNRGAVAHSWVLSKYQDDANQPLDLVDPTFSSKFGYPLAFWTSDSAISRQLDDALYQVKQTASGATQTITFTWSDGTLAATKTLTFDGGYVPQVRAQVTRNGAPLPVALAWPGGFGDRAMPGDFSTQSLFQQSGTSVTTIKAKNVHGGAVQQGAMAFAGLQDQFFAVAILPAAPVGAAPPPLTVTDIKNSYEPRLVDATGHVVTNKPVDTVGFAVSTGDQLDVRLFVGPKQVSLLESVDPALRGLVNFGWFSFIAYPLFLWMNWTYVHWIPNYGWAILFLTFVITMAGFPLKMKAQKSQAKMMALQPRINSLNAKMKKYGMRDPRRQEVQQEIMKVYGEHGVNPLGGCLPMLIILPLIYAFYDVLEYSIELRHAPWLSYIHDLSAKDPYFVLPVLVMVSTFFSFALMPTMPGQDPRQTKMMRWMMPIVTGWFFFYMPAGVNLYYLGYNIVSGGQQWVANRTYNDRAAAEVAATEKARERESKGKKQVIETKAVTPKR
ncbi:MAG: membrane protein insertase YidC, partial [Terriglobales bacterium]